MSTLFSHEEIFIDRETEMARLEQLIAFSVNQKGEEEPSDYQRVMHLVGKSNIGKSFLLNEFGYRLSQRKSFLVLSITFKEYIGLAEDGFVLRVLKSIDEIISTELNLKSQYKEPSTKDINVYAQWVLRGVDQVQRDKVFVFLLDEISMLSKYQAQSLEDYILAGVLHFPNVVIVLAGRHVESSWKDFALRPHSGNVIKLSGFDFELTQKQIQTINPNASDFVGEIHKISGGSPGNNKKIVEQLGDPPQFDELKAIRACNQEFFTALDSTKQGLPQSTANELLPTLQALCVLQDFDKDYEMPVMLSAHPALDSSWTVQHCSDLLKILSVIQIGPGKLIDWDMEKSALAMEEQTRSNLEKELMIRDKDLWKKLHCAAMNIYTAWTKEYGMDSIFADKADYHKRKLINAGIDPETCG